MVGLTLDSGALIAAERGSRRFWAFWKETLARGVDITVPASVVAQVWRGHRSARVALVLKACVIEPLDAERARAVGTLCGQASSSDVVDAHVVLGAAARRDVILTSDPDDLVRLAACFRPAPRVIVLDAL